MRRIAILEMHRVIAAEVDGGRSRGVDNPAAEHKADVETVVGVQIDVPLDLAIKVAQSAIDDRGSAGRAMHSERDERILVPVRGRCEHPFQQKVAFADLAEGEGPAVADKRLHRQPL